MSRTLQWKELLLELPEPEGCRVGISLNDDAETAMAELHWEADGPLEDIAFTLWQPLKEIHGVWNPSLRFNKGFDVDWVAGFRSEALSWAPVVSLYRYDGRNALTLAADDALHTMRIDSGVNEETARFKCAFHLPADGSGRKTRSLRLRLDARPLPYHRCLKEVSRWWEELYPPLPTPETATRPLLSTWYSFHLGLDEKSLLEECSRGRELGLEGIIIDDGWQTEDNRRTYAYCGEWKPAPSKIPDMASLVQKIHAMDMSCMLWYALPYIGEKTDDYENWKDRVLEIEPSYPAWHVLDPRYPEVREHIISTYVRALKDWDLDGFKLDFLDRFSRAPADRNPLKEGMDTMAIPEAADLLLSTLAERLVEIKAEILLECRQTYIGPLSRRYGNVFRAEDCPNSSLTNRVSLLDIRLLCGETATHADPLMWNTEESPESAAMQFTHSLFSVPQVSVPLAELSDEHRRMIRFWVGFYKEHRDLLLRGDMAPHSPEGLYDQVVLEDDREQIIICYNRPVVVPREDRNFTVVNAAWEKELILKRPEDASERAYVLKNCLGEEVSSGRIGGGLRALSVPPASVLSVI